MVRRHGIAVAGACSECAAGIGNPEPYAPGRHLAVIHDEHVSEFVAAGWEVIDYRREPSDVICPHYRALCEADPDPG